MTVVIDDTYIIQGRPSVQKAGNEHNGYEDIAYCAIAPEAWYEFMKAKESGSWYDVRLVKHVELVVREANIDD